jgi:hypothetical protein
MNASIVAIVVVPVLLFVLCATASVLLARKKDARLDERAPGTLSYKWGYFLGYYGIIFGAVVTVLGVAMMATGIYYDWFAIVLAYLLVFGIASYGVLNRRKWGWIFQIPLTLNMGLWAFNAVYLSNRWRELS